MKYIFSPFLFIATFFCSCNDAENSVNGSHMSQDYSPHQEVNKNTYAYTLISTKKENERNGDFDEMALYSCGDKPNIDTLIMFCHEKKKGFIAGTFHYLVFFNRKENAQFPNNPFTALYGEENPSIYIKAIYEYNRLNGYSKLDFYEKNSWESSPVVKDI